MSDCQKWRVWERRFHAFPSTLNPWISRLALSPWLRPCPIHFNPWWRWWWTRYSVDNTTFGRYRHERARTESIWFLSTALQDARSQPHVRTKSWRHRSWSSRLRFRSLVCSVPSRNTRSCGGGGARAAKKRKTILCLYAHCRFMRFPGCKNRPAPFTGQMSYKATKPGLALTIVYLSMLYTVLLFIRAPFYVLLVFVCMCCL